jgi:hypothetical protein
LTSLIPNAKVRVLLKYLPFQFGQDWLQKLIRRAMDAAASTT